MSSIIDDNSKIKYVTLTKPFEGFDINMSDNSASTGYANELYYFSKNMLKFLGSKREFYKSHGIGSSSKLSFNFIPKKRGKSYIIFKHGRSWQPETINYTAYIILIE